MRLKQKKRFERLSFGVTGQKGIRMILTGLVLATFVGLCSAMTCKVEVQAAENVIYVSATGTGENDGKDQDHPTTLDHAATLVNENEANSATIQLIGDGDIDLMKTITFDKNKDVTLDLNGRNLKMPWQSVQQYDGSGLNIIFNGKFRVINSDSSKQATIVKNRNLRESSCPIFTLQNGAQLFFGTGENDGKIKLETASSNDAKYGIVQSQSSQDTSNITFAGGTITLQSCSQHVFCVSGGKAKITVQNDAEVHIRTDAALIHWDGVTLEENTVITSPMTSVEYGPPTSVADITGNHVNNATLARGCRVTFQGGDKESGYGKCIPDNNPKNPPLSSYYVGLKAGETTKLPENGFTLQYYDFAGWKDETGKTYQDEEEITPGTTDMTLTAQWKRHEYQITYDLDGGTLEGIDEFPTFYTVESEDITLTEKPVKTGYGSFRGWNLNDAYYFWLGYTLHGNAISDEININVQSLKNSSGGLKDLHYKAIFDGKNQYYIHYDPNGGDDNENASNINQYATYDVECDLYECKFTKEGYVFAGWNTKQDGSGTWYGAMQKVRNLTTERYGTVNLYAQWRDPNAVPYHEPEHVHDGSNYRVVTVAATETEEGRIDYICPVCGQVMYSVPISTYGPFNQNVAKKIRDAKAGTPVRIDTVRYVSFHEMVKDAIAANPNATVIVGYKYQGKFYEMTIPAGTTKATLDALWGNGKFCGFRKMASVFPTVAK